MLVLGIDPGTANVGIGLVKNDKNRYQLVHYESITTKPDQKMPDRIHIIFESLLTIIKDYKPDIVVVESLFFAINARSAINVGKAMGVISLASTTHKIPVVEYTPLQVKKYLCGYGRAKKPEIQKQVKKLLRLKKVPRPQHAADALAVALTYFENKSKNTAKT